MNLGCFQIHPRTTQGAATSSSLGSVGGHEVHKTVKSEPPRTPRTQRSAAAFIKGAISRNRTEFPGRTAISSWRSWCLGGSIRMGSSGPLSITWHIRSLANCSWTRRQICAVPRSSRSSKSFGCATFRRIAQAPPFGNQTATLRAVKPVGTVRPST